MRDWRRLTPLLRRVKTFTIDKYSRSGKNRMFLDDSVFEKVLSTRPPSNFMPSLRRLIVEPHGRNFDRAEKYLVVLSGSITTLEFEVLTDSRVTEKVAYFLLEAIERAPNVKHLSFYNDCTHDEFGEYLQQIFPKLIALESIKLSSCSLNATMISALSILPLLNSIQFKWWGNGQTDEVRHIHDIVLGGDGNPPFPKLRAFALQSHLPNITRYLSDKFSL